jgi:mono/diheme cytochrome c family protein
MRSRVRCPAGSRGRPRAEAPRRHGGAVRGRFAAALMLVAAAALLGCGTNIDALVAQTGNAAATTVLDILLTDFANQVADSFNPPPPQPPVDGADNTNDNGGGGTGDPTAGQQVFAAKGCGACHGPAAEGGVGPALMGNDESADLEARFGAGATHNGKTLTEQEIADIAAWLIAGTSGGGTDGAAVFAANCAACHGADGVSGFAPDIAGFSAADLTAGLSSGTHASIALTDEEIAAVAAFLGG